MLIKTGKLSGRGKNFGKGWVLTEGEDENLSDENKNWEKVGEGETDEKEYYQFLKTKGYEQEKKYKKKGKTGKRKLSESNES